MLRCSIRFAQDKAQHDSPAGAAKYSLTKHIHVQYTLLELSPSTILARNARHQVLKSSDPVYLIGTWLSHPHIQGGAGYAVGTLERSSGASL
jgi:hypothetical protein